MKSEGITFPEGDPLNVYELSLVNPALSGIITVSTGDHTPAEYIKIFPTFTITWTRGKEWIDIYATRKGRDRLGRYGFNLSEWRWAYGANAEGALEIKKQLREFFNKV